MSEQTNLTFQQMFDKAYTGVIKQGGPSFIGDSCVYRNESGRSCSVGQLIDDDKYNADIEGASVKGIVGRNETGLDLDDGQLALLGVLTQCNVDVETSLPFLSDLQNAHDAPYLHTTVPADSEFITQFKKKMSYVADKWQLTVPQL